MGLPAVRLTLLLGPSVPVPAPAPLLEALESVEVTHTDQGRSGFEVVFRVGRGGADVADYPLLSSPLLKPFGRVILLVTFGGIPRVLSDGIIALQQLTPGTGPGQATFTLKGEDISVMMDQQEKNAEHPAQSEDVIARKLIFGYVQYGLIPLVVPPPTLEVPNPLERIPTQQGTDLQYLREMAARFAYVFYITPGPVPGANRAYWGPPIREGVPQPALSFNLGPHSNVEALEFQNDALAPTAVSGTVQDRATNRTIPVPPLPLSRKPLSGQPPDLLNRLQVRQRVLRTTGLTMLQALARAQAMSDASAGEAVIATGELDALRYNGILRARELVGLRGAGHAHDGLYYVKEVTHAIRRGEYKQRFTLTREGLGAREPSVPT